MPAQNGRENSTQWPPGRGDLEAVEEQVVLRRSGALALGCLNSGPRAALGPVEHHVHRRPAGAARGEDALGLAHHLGLGLADLVGGEHRPDAVLVQAEALAHRLELLVAT